MLRQRKGSGCGLNIRNCLHQQFMRSRPNNYNKAINRAKSPVLLGSLNTPLSDQKPQDKNFVAQRHETIKMGSGDVRLRVGSPQVVRDAKKHQQKIALVKEEKSPSKETASKARLIEGNIRSVKDEDDKTTQQSSSQHLQYVTGQYQLDSYDLFSRRKNVKFQEKIQNLQTHQKRGSSRGSSRNGSILKNGSRLLDKSLVSSQKSASIQNSFTAVKKCKIGLASPQDNANLMVKKKYQSILQQLMTSKEKGRGKEKYIDELFPPVEASIFSTSVHRKGHISRTKDEIVWMRLSEIFRSPTQVYTKKKGAGDITIWKGEKGYAQNYLVTSMNAIRGCSQLLEFMFQKEQVNPHGVYLVKIYQENTWKYVIVDDLIPCVRKRGKGKHQDAYLPVFVNVIPKEGETSLLWPFLLEKAYASYYSSYENLCYGNPVDFVTQLLGAPYKQLILVNKKIEKEKLQHNLQLVGSAFSQGKVVALGWSEQKATYYPVYAWNEIYTGQNIQLGLSDPSNSFKVSRVDLADLPQHLTSVYIYHFRQYQNSTTCPVYPPKSYKEQRPKRAEKQHRSRYLQIPGNDTTSLRAFTLFKKAKCCVDLRQKENRFYWQCGITEYIWVRCLLLQKQYDGQYRWVSGKYSNQKHIIFQQNLDAGEYLLVIMAEWRQRHNKELTVVLYSDCDFLKFERKNHVRDERIIELSCMDLAQRHGKLNQINKSICSYTYLCEDTGLVIENIVNERHKGEVTIMRSINGLKSKVEILPINKEFEVDAPQDYGAIERVQGKKVISQSVEIDIQRGQSFTVVLRMRGGMDRKFFRVFNFG